MIEDWIDELCAVWAFDDARLGQVKSYNLVKDADFPSAINASDLALQPVALTIPSAMQAEYSAGGPRIAYWKGVTEFHVAPDVNPGRLPALVPWYGMILAAAAGNMKLNDSVELFLLQDREDAIAGPLALKYGDESPHWGFLVHWQVKEQLTLTVSA